MTAKHLEQTDPRFRNLESSDLRLRFFTSALVVLLVVTVVSLYLPQAWGWRIGFLPAPETHTTLAIGILGLAVLFYLYVMKRLGELTTVRRELLGTRLREELLRGRLSELSSLFETTAHATERPNRDQMLDLIVRRVLICLEADQCSILLVEEATRELVCGAVAGRDEEFVRGVRVPLGQGIAGWVAAHNEPVVLDDAEMAVRFPDERKTGRDISSSLCVPLNARGSVIGVLCVNRLGQNAPFTAMDARLVTIFAEHVAGALQRLGEISDLDRRTLDLETSNQHLARLNRMHELFLIAVRREMRSPLAAIQACADRLQREGTGMASERHDHLARAILEQAAQLRDVLTEVLELSRLEAGHAALARSAVPPNDILRNAVRVVESVAAQSEIHFETDLSPVPPAHLDAAKWRRALEFLLLGAVRLSSTGDVLRARSVTQGDDLTITLSGFGSGAAAGDLQACAQALDASPDGPGAPESLSLGLLVAQRYVEMHGGTLRLLNANGPVFRVHLPARARALPPGAPLEIEPPLARPAARAPAAEAPAAEAPAAEAPAAEAPAAEPAWNEAKEAA